MKQILLTALALVWSVLTFSQTVVENPKTGMSTSENIKITKVELTDSATVLYFHTVYLPNNWIFIPNETFIQPVGSEKKLFITATKGIPKHDKFWMPASGEVDYQLIFPKVESSVTAIDYGEANGGGWNIFDIQLRKASHKSVIPVGLLGNWFSPGDGSWKLGLMDSVAIYQNKVWSYGEFVYKNGNGLLVLKANGHTKKINLKLDGTILRLSEPSGKPLDLVSTCPPNKADVKEEKYRLPVFKTDSATLSGFIKGYSRRSGINSFSVFANNIITGDQSEIKVAIGPAGDFSAKVPLSNPKDILVRAGVYNGSVFLEPGLETFLMVESGETPMFMGDGAKLNADLNLLRPINSLVQKNLDEKILEMKAEQYKQYCKSMLQHDLDSMMVLLSKGVVGVRAYQVMCVEKELNYANMLLNYGRYLGNAYRVKNNIPPTQRSLPVNPEILGDEFYGFITNELVNNQLAVMTSGYNSFINSLKYTDILRKGAGSMQPTIRGIAQMLDASGYVYAEGERSMLDAMAETETPESMAFQEKYAEQIMTLYMKHLDVLKSTLQEKGGNVLMSEIGKLLTESGVSLTDDEKNLIKVCTDRENSDQVIKNRQIKEKYQKEYQRFLSKNETAVGAYYMQEQKKARSEVLSKKFGIQAGLVTDIMNAQDLCRGIVSELTPIADEEILKFKGQVSIPFIASYVETCNRQTKAKIEANKRMKVAVVNEVPKVEADQLFDAIMAKYKGKVVYVDFWATWCSPCRAGIERIKPMKEEMAKENVAFVYITGESSPKKTYDNMIPAIRGEHYRLSASEWDVVCKKFNVTGIPHYVLVGKNGSVINPKLGHLDNNALKPLLLKHIQE